MKFEPISPERRRPGLRQAGFGLLEAIVALTLLASTGMALFAWINTNMQAAVRLQEIDAAAALKITAAGLMSGVNPLVQPSGERRFNGLWVRWTAEPVGELRPTAGQVAGGTGKFVVQLFRTDVLATNAESKQEIRFELQLLGVRPATDPAAVPARR